MNTTTFRLLARLDLLEIGKFIAKDNPIAAANFVDMLERKCLMLADFPQMGVKRKNLRMYPVRAYRIFYEPTSSGVEIVRVVHSARNIEKT